MRVVSLFKKLIERNTLTVTEKEPPVYLIVLGSLNWFDEKKK